MKPKLNWTAALVGCLVGGVLSCTGIVHFDFVSALIASGIMVLLVVLLWTYAVEPRGKNKAKEVHMD